MDIYKNIYYNFDYEGCYKLIKIGENYWWKWQRWDIGKDVVVWDMSEDRFDLVHNKEEGVTYNYKLPQSFFFIEGDL